MKRKRPTKAELEEMKARHAQVLENARRLRELAERAQAKLDAQSSGQ
jgi:type II secretory pathway component PulM